MSRETQCQAEFRVMGERVLSCDLEWHHGGWHHDPRGINWEHDGQHAKVRM